MQLLPTWTLTDRHPAFFETESGSAIEATARVYAAMNNLIKEYNQFAENTNEIIESFKAETEQEQECFKQCITELVETYIKSIDIKIDKQDKIISDAVQYMSDNIVQTTTNIVNEKLANGEIVVGTVYNEETESMDIVASEV